MQLRLNTGYVQFTYPDQKDAKLLPLHLPWMDHGPVC